MPNENDLEEACEDAVFEICCTRERYSRRCANQLEKYLNLKSKAVTAEVQKAPAKIFEIPIITEEQEELFEKLSKIYETSKKATSEEVNIRKKIKSLDSILNSIERSKNTETHKLLAELLPN